MWPLCVVKVYNAGKFQLTVRPCRNGHLVEPFALEDTIGTLCNGIFQRIPALGHADIYAVALELGHICIAAILATAV